MRQFRPSRLVPIVMLFAFGACQSGVQPAVSEAAPTATTAPSPTAAPIAMYTCDSRTVTWDGSSAIDLTGTWAGNDAGIYYLRQLGDQVWWLGMSGRGEPLVKRGTDWTNVYRGTLSGDTITGTYADVPQGRILDQGPVILKLTPTADGGISLVRTDPLLQTGFGATRFTPCSLR
jgi:hypothetical protein